MRSRRRNPEPVTMIMLGVAALGALAAGFMVFGKKKIGHDEAIVPPRVAQDGSLAAAQANVDAAKVAPVAQSDVELAAEAAGVTVAELEAAARFLGQQSGDPSFTGAMLVAMGVTPRDIQDAVFSMRNGG